MTADVAAPVYLAPGNMPAGARASIFAATVFVDVLMTATWSALSWAIQHGLWGVERHAERVAVQCDARDQVTRAGELMSIATTCRSRSEDT